MRFYLFKNSPRVAGQCWYVVSPQQTSPGGRSGPPMCLCNRGTIPNGTFTSLGFPYQALWKWPLLVTGNCRGWLQASDGMLDVSADASGQVIAGDLKDRVAPPNPSLATLQHFIRPTSKVICRLWKEEALNGLRWWFCYSGGVGAWNRK